MESSKSCEQNVHVLMTLVTLSIPYRLDTSFLDIKSVQVNGQTSKVRLSGFTVNSDELFW
jgi:hypothetical protein